MSAGLLRTSALRRLAVGVSVAVVASLSGMTGAQAAAPPPSYELTWPGGGSRQIAADGAGHVYAPFEDTVREFDETGDLIRTLPSPPPGQPDSGNSIGTMTVAVAGTGEIYALEGSGANRRVLRWTPEGAFDVVFNGVTSGWDVIGMAVGPQGEFYVLNVEDRNEVTKFDRDGQFLLRINGPAAVGPETEHNPSNFARMAVDRDGRLLVTDHSANIVRVYDTQGKEGKEVASIGKGTGGPRSLSAPQAITTDTARNVYVTEEVGRVQVFTAAGTYVTSWGSAGDRPGQFLGPVSITIGSNGRVLVADRVGVTRDSYGTPRVQVFSPHGHVTRQPASSVQSWGVPGIGVAQFRGPRVLAVATDGSFYVADGAGSRIQHFNAAMEFLGAWGNPGSVYGYFTDIGGIATAPDGSVLVTDTATGKIQQFTAAGVLVRSWGGLGTAPGTFRGAYGVAVASDGTVYVTDRGNARVQVFSATGTWLRSWGSAGTGHGQFAGPVGITVRGQGGADEVYVADQLNRRVQVFAPDGTFLRTLGAAGSGGPALRSPQRVAVEAEGNTYVVDVDANQVFSYAPDGSYLAPVGTPGSEAGQLLSPSDIAVDRTGAIVIADRGNDRVQRFSVPTARYYAPTLLHSTWTGGDAWPAPTDPAAFAAAGDVTFTADSGPVVRRANASSGEILSWGTAGTGPGQFGPGRKGIALAPDAHSVYVTDPANARVQQFGLDGTFLRTWGTRGTADGQFSNPAAITVDAAGNVYVVDAETSRVQTFTAQGVLLRAWGAKGRANGQLRTPMGVSVWRGNVFVADTGNDRVQVFSLIGRLLRSFGSGGVELGQLREPTGITVDTQGRVYVTEFAGSRVSVFSTGGGFLMAFRPYGFTAALPVGGVAVDAQGHITISVGPEAVPRTYNQLQQFDALVPR